MTFLRRFTRGDLQLTRIEAFTDAVFAIIATLLVLELKVPIVGRHPTVSELGGELHELLPKFLAWLLSFIILCKFCSITIVS